MRLFACILFLSACLPDRTYKGPESVRLAPGSESTFGQCPGKYNLDLSQKQVDFSQFVEADYDNQMRGRIIVKGDGGQFVGCLLSRDIDQCSNPEVVFTYPRGLQVCIQTQHCCETSAEEQHSRAFARQRATAARLEPCLPGALFFFFDKMMFFGYIYMSDFIGLAPSGVDKHITAWPTTQTVSGGLMDRFNVALAWLKLNWLVTTSLAVGIIGIMFGCGSLLLAVRNTRELHQLEYTVRHDLGNPDATRIGKFRFVPTLDADGKPIKGPCPGQPEAQCTAKHRVRQSAWEEMESLDGRIHKLAAEAETRRLFEKVVKDRRQAESAEVTKQWREQVETMLATNRPAEVADDSDPPPVVPEGPLDGEVLPSGNEFDRQVAEFCAKQNPTKHGEKYYISGCGGGSTHENSTYVCTSYDSTYPYIHDCKEVKD